MIYKFVRSGSEITLEFSPKIGFELMRELIDFHLKDKKIKKIKIYIKE